MIKYFFHIAAPLVLLFFFAACAGQPRVPAPKSSQSKVLWDENRNPYADENDNVDVSDLDKEVTTGEEAGTAPSQLVQRIPFPAAEYSALARSGKGTIQGHIYLQDVYGTKIYGAKTRLYLNPVTSYSRQWYEQSYINGYKMGKADPRLFNYLRFTASDDQGAFAFYGVPSGSYYLIGTVTCGSECGYANPKNIRIAKEVYIEGNQVINVDLSRPIQ
jgi:hypothetical protein